MKLKEEVYIIKFLKTVHEPISFKTFWKNDVNEIKDVNNLNDLKKYMFTVNKQLFESNK